MHKYEKIMASPNLTEKEKKKITADCSTISTKNDERLDLYLNIIECYDTILNGKWLEMKKDLALFKATGSRSIWGPILQVAAAESIWQESTDFETFMLLYIINLVTSTIEFF